MDDKNLAFAVLVPLFFLYLIITSPFGCKLINLLLPLYLTNLKMSKWKRPKYLLNTEFSK